MEIFSAIAIVLVLVGGLLIWYGIYRHRKHGARYAQAIASWTRTRATVIDAGLVDRESSDSDSDGDTTTWYEPRLHYRYKADGRPWEGDRTALCNSLRFSLFEPAQKWLLAHAPGTEIDLWYDPAKPADSAPLLDKPNLASAGIIVFVGIAFMLFATALLAGFAL